ncbi:hypothetical protein C7Y66_06720 [Chroococcidiopsis sp. CCALA 051]|uniref:hypothetical protein n=1 Tax=Chroococcidiopsis sp. CCALA 051 TaxID=869949 RepID=UPI000D0DD626|nr:hypothetical protein [Chroococcidiopsis sp. CCALA 051]PSM49877.1 hypothetical protein C7Y66_06720 [Chroococcidiopsis sp. CCALA 051]
MPQGVVFMESGVQFDWEQCSEALALIRLGSRENSNFSLLQNLVLEASARYPQLRQLRFVNVPIPTSQLESWSYYLAAQLIVQWRSLPLLKYSVESVVSELGLNDPGSREPCFTTLNRTATATLLTKQLAIRMESLQQKCQQQLASQRQQWLEQETRQLAEWFTSPTAESGSLAQLQSNVLVLRAKMLRQLQGYFDQMHQIGARSLLEWLNSLIKTFDSIRANYEARRQDCLRRESSAWRAYYNLNPQLEERRWKLFSSDRANWQVVLSAFATAYNFKLEAEIYTQSAQLVGELAQQTRLYADSVKQIDDLLARVQEYFTARGSIGQLFLPLLQNFLVERVNAVQLRDELESWTNCTFDQWHTLDSSQTTALCEQILLKTRPLCLEVYAECCRCIFNLELLNRQDQTIPSEPGLTKAEKLISLQVQNVDIQDVLELLAKMAHVCVVADRSIGGTVSVSLDRVPFTEALEVVAAAGNLTYTKNSNIYTFNRLSGRNPPTTIISENSNIYTFERQYDP